MVLAAVDPGLLRQNRLRVDGRHAEKGDYPHPEDGTGAARQDRAGCADDIAGTDLSGYGCRQSLERTHAFFMFFPVEREIAENAPESFSEAADLDKSGPDGIPETYKDQ